MKRWLIGVFGWVPGVWAGPMEYRPAPVDNPLKGMVPYVSEKKSERFPHSMQFRYFAMGELMKGRGEFDWGSVEETLKLTQSRGCQLVMRVFLEYPGKGDMVPPFLKREGVKVVEWESGGDKSFSPDYEDPKMRSALGEFIAAFGKKYDGDRRIGFISAGMLGSWGEWHTYPRGDLWASKEVQNEVLEAYEKAFEVMPVLLRYPSDGRDRNQAKNVGRGFGYHDDSFCWATLETGRQEDSWFFMPKMKAAGGLDTWKTQPIGGELRPELWKQSFTDDPHPKDQGFLKCVEATHVTWLMDSGLFGQRFPLADQRRDRAIQEVRRMGYEYHVSSWEVVDGQVEVTVENRGVAPFYQDWPVELEVTRGGKTEVKTKSGLLPNILPGESKNWCFDVGMGSEKLRLRVPNPMVGGKPLRFSNREQGEEWLDLKK